MRQASRAASFLNSTSGTLASREGFVLSCRLDFAFSRSCEQERDPTRDPCTLAWMLGSLSRPVVRDRPGQPVLAFAWGSASAAHRSPLFALLGLMTPHVLCSARRI